MLQSILYVVIEILMLHNWILYSGLVIPEKLGGNHTISEITAFSGSVFLHFYSDAAYNMSGFNISYRSVLIDSA